VRDDDDRTAPTQTSERGEHALAALGVQTFDRLVEEQHRLLGRESPRDGNQASFTA